MATETLQLDGTNLALDAHSYASTHVELPKQIADKVKAFSARIPDDHLAEDGREKNPHITVKYGLHLDSASRVKNALKDEMPVKFRMNKLHVFPANEKRSSDVLVSKIDSPDLHRLNGKVCGAAPHVDTYPTYEPHATIAYLKPGMGEKYAAMSDLDGIEGVADEVVHSDRDAEETRIPLTGRHRLPAMSSEEIALALAGDSEDESSGRWVTVDGVHIMIKGGVVTKGPPALMGGKASDAHEHMAKLRDREAGTSRREQAYHAGKGDNEESARHGKLAETHERVAKQHRAHAEIAKREEAKPASEHPDAQKIIYKAHDSGVPLTKEDHDKLRSGDAATHARIKNQIAGQWPGGEPKDLGDRSSVPSNSAASPGSLKEAMQSTAKIGQGERSSPGDGKPESQWSATDHGHAARLHSRAASNFEGAGDDAKAEAHRKEVGRHIAAEKAKASAPQEPSKPAGEAGKAPTKSDSPLTAEDHNKLASKHARASAKARAAGKDEESYAHNAKVQEHHEAAQKLRSGKTAEAPAKSGTTGGAATDEQVHAATTELHAASGKDYITIQQLRQHIADKHGAAAASHENLDPQLKRMRADDKVRLVSHSGPVAQGTDYSNLKNEVREGVKGSLDNWSGRHEEFTKIAPIHKSSPPSATGAAGGVTASNPEVGGTIAGEPRHFTPEQHAAAIEHLKSLPLKELRRRQDINNSQLQQRHAEMQSRGQLKHDDPAMENGLIRQGHLDTAVASKLDAPKGKKKIALSAIILDAHDLDPSKEVPGGLEGLPTFEEVDDDKIASTNADGSPVFAKRKIPVAYYWKEIARTPGDGKLWTHRGAVAANGNPLEFPLTREDFDDAVTNFKERSAAGIRPFIPDSHVEQKSASANNGEVIDLKRAGEKLMAKLKVVGTAAQEKVLKNDVSVYLVNGNDQLVVDAHGKQYKGRVLHHVALTPNPALPHLGKFERIAASADAIQPDVPVFSYGRPLAAQSRRSYIMTPENAAKVRQILNLGDTADDELDDIVATKAIALSATVADLVLLKDAAAEELKASKAETVAAKAETLALSGDPTNDPMAISLIARAFKTEREQVIASGVLSEAGMKEIDLLFLNAGKPTRTALALSAGSTDPLYMRLCDILRRNPGIKTNSGTQRNATATEIALSADADKDKADPAEMKRLREYAHLPQK